jgi:murein L,D-transpeptidase YcbB/YkuD
MPSSRLPSAWLLAGTAALAVTARVYATREGLVGRTTANGHVIASRDHFVALPSRRALSPKGSGDYSVKVKGFQNAQKLSADGIVGPDTWGALVETVQPGSTGQAVRAVQSQLTAHGVATTVSGTFDATTQANVERFQTAAGLTASGTVDAGTWKSLVA